MRRYCIFTERDSPRVYKLHVQRMWRFHSLGISRSYCWFTAHGVIKDCRNSSFVCTSNFSLVDGTSSSSSFADSFYKNITLYMTQFWVRICPSYRECNVQLTTTTQYSFFNNFSGQIAYESWTISFYNVIFTVLPPLVIGVFDQFVSARILDRYPQLYALGQKNVFFTKTAFWLWVGNALYHSLVSVIQS